jgi:hypothetical protein
MILLKKAMERLIDHSVWAKVCLCFACDPIRMFLLLDDCAGVRKKKRDKFC